MDILAAVNALLALTNTLASMAQNAQAISSIIQRAQAEGRTTLTPEEWSIVTNSDDASRQALISAITAALTKK